MITHDSDVEKIVKDYPEAVKIFIRHGLPCLVCGQPFWGSVAELAEKNQVDVEELLKDLQELEHKAQVDDKKI